jgi:hypothetical protein
MPTTVMLLLSLPGIYPTIKSAFATAWTGSSNDSLLLLLILLRKNVANGIIDSICRRVLVQLRESSIDLFQNPDAKGPSFVAVLRRFGHRCGHRRSHLRPQSHSERPLHGHEANLGDGR